MPVHSAREIYHYAVLAGFSPDQAVTMTAIALAESGGRSGAHNSSGEDSRGLWQINVNAHRSMTGRDLSDPLENAKAAFEVSRQGRDISPWTTTHGGGHAKYLAYRVEAQTAAGTSGESGPLGSWSGTQGYGHPVPAGAGGTGTVGPAHPGSGVDAFVQAALDQSGDHYVFGAETSLSDPNPSAFDCSELTQWAAAQAGVDLPDGSWTQYLSLQKQGATMSVDEALHTKGALLFSFSDPPTASGGRPSKAHVAISLGDGRTIEARGTKYGVGSWSGEHRFNYAAAVPGLVAGPAPAATAVDTDRDGLTDSLDSRLGTDPGTVDTDRDGLTDALEAQLGTDPRSADTDHDGLTDSFELTRTHTNLGAADSDHDGVLDSVEHLAGTDSMNPLSSPYTGQQSVASVLDPTDTAAPHWGLDDPHS